MAVAGIGDPGPDRNPKAKTGITDPGYNIARRSARST